MALDEQKWSAITNAYAAGNPDQAGVLLDMDNTLRENQKESARLERELKELKRKRPFWKRIFG